MYFLLEESQVAEERRSLRVYAHHRERCASGKQHPQEHRLSLVEPTKGVRQGQEPQSLRPERLH